VVNHASFRADTQAFYLCKPFAGPEMGASSNLVLLNIFACSQYSHHQRSVWSQIDRRTRLSLADALKRQCR